MLLTLIKATAGVVVLLVGWVVIDLAWRRVFRDVKQQPGCRGCIVCSRRCDTDDEDAPAPSSEAAHGETELGTN